MKNKYLKKKKSFTLVLSISLTVGLSLLGIAVFKMSSNFNDNIQSYNIKSNSSLKANENLNIFINKWSLSPVTDIDSVDFPIIWDLHGANKDDLTKLKFIDEDHPENNLVNSFEYLDNDLSNNLVGEDISASNVNSNKKKVYKLVLTGKELNTDKIKTTIESIVLYRE